MANDKVEFLFDAMYLRDRFSGVGLFSRDLNESIKRSQRFLLDDDFLEVTHKVSSTSNTNILKALPLARLPYRSVWIEFNEQARRHLFFPSKKGNPFLDEVRRVGYFVEEKPGDGNRQRVALHKITWRKSGEIDVSPFEIWMDWSEHPPKLMPIVTGQFIEMVKTINGLAGAVLTGLAGEEVRAAHANEEPRTLTEEEEKAVQDLMWRFKISLSHYHIDFWEKASRRSPMPADVEKWLLATGIDHGNDALFLYCIVCLLNSKNILSEETVDRTEENKARRRQNLPPRCDVYRKITINFDRAQVNRAKSAGVEDPAKMRRHMVRGHFKRKKNGIFWWNDFERGDASLGYAHKDYDVAGDQLDQPDLNAGEP